MRPMSTLQYRGIPDWDEYDVEQRVNFGVLSALPTGIVYKTDAGGSTDGTAPTFEGVAGGGRIALEVTSAGGARWLRADGWDITSPTSYRRVLFEAEGLYFPDGNARSMFLNLRDTTNVAHGLYWGTRGNGSPPGEVAYNNGTSSQVIQTTWSPSRMERNLKLTIGVGYEIDPMLAKRDILVTVNGKVVWRTTQPTMSLAGTLRPSITFTSSSGTLTNYLHGLRLRFWRYR